MIMFVVAALDSWNLVRELLPETTQICSCLVNGINLKVRASFNQKDEIRLWDYQTLAG